MKPAAAMWPVFCYRKDRTVAKIAVIGTGYVGLCTAVTFAHLGNTVIGLDIDAAKVARLTAGECPIFEPGLETLLAEQIAAQTTRLYHQVCRRDRSMPISSSSASTPRPPRTAARTCASCEPPPPRLVHRSPPAHRTIVVDKSTMPVGSGDMVHGTPRASMPRLARALPSSRTRSSCARERRCTTCSTPTGSSSARATGPPPRRSPRYTLVRHTGADHRPAHGGDDQVRLQRLPRHPHLLHQ